MRYLERCAKLENDSRPDGPLKQTNSKVGNVIRVSSGNFLEMYDFMVYAYYASYIAQAFFPPTVNMHR